MDRFSLQKTTTRTLHVAPVAQTGSARPGDWKHELKSKLRTTQHERSSDFNDLLNIYIATDAAENPKLDLSRLICGCMKHEEVGVLCDILKYEHIKSLCIEGPLKEQGWKTLVKAMPDSLPVKELTLSRVVMSASKFELLVHLLSGMDEVETVSLNSVMVKRSPFFNLLNCPNFSSIKNLKVSGHSNPKLGVYPLVRKFLEACQVEHVSIEVSGAISVHEHSKLAKLLKTQARMDSLQLAIEHRASPREFECYMPFLCGKTPKPLVKLDLRRCFVQTDTFNELIKGLSQNQPLLESLVISKCWESGHPEDKETVSIDLLPLAEMKSLKQLDLSCNDFLACTTLALLAELKKRPNGLVILNLSENLIEPKTISAMASFLRDNDTLHRLSFECYGPQNHFANAEEMLEALTEAAEHNLVLQHLDIRWKQVPEDYRNRLTKSLDRNRQLVIAAAIRGGVYAIGNAHQLQIPYEVADLVFQHGLALNDALSASMVDKVAWGLREQILREEAEEILRRRHQ